MFSPHHPLDARHARQAVEKGFTLSLKSLHWRNRQMAELASSIEEELCASVNANL